MAKVQHVKERFSVVGRSGASMGAEGRTLLYYGPFAVPEPVEGLVEGTGLLCFDRLSTRMLSTRNVFYGRLTEQA